MDTYDVWRMTKRDSRRVGREHEALPAIAIAKTAILPSAFVRVEHWKNGKMTVVWDSMDGDSAEQGRKSQLRDFIRKPHGKVAGGLR